MKDKAGKGVRQLAGIGGEQTILEQAG